MKVRGRQITSHRRLLAKVSPCGYFCVYEQAKGETESRRDNSGPGRPHEEVSLVQLSIPGTVSMENTPVPIRSVPKMRSDMARLDATRGLKALDLTSPPNSRLFPKRRSPRGMSGLSGYAKRLTYNATSYLEKRYGKDQLSFLTLTFPGITDVELAAIQENWAEAVRRFTNDLRKKLRARSLPDDLVGAVEIQTARANRTGQLVPHIHLVFVGRKRGKGWALCPGQLKKQWKRLWKTLTGINLSMDGAVDLRRVIKSASRYLSKYLSKGRTKAATNQETGEISSFVSCWYICSTALRRLYKASITVSHVAAVQILEWIAEQKAGVTHRRMVVTFPDGGTFVPCVYGWLDAKLSALVTRSMLEIESENRSYAT